MCDEIFAYKKLPAGSEWVHEGRSNLGYAGRLGQGDPKLSPHNERYRLGDTLILPWRQCSADSAIEWAFRFP